MITLSHIEKTYEGADGAVTALKDVSLSVARGEIFGVIGLIILPITLVVIKTLNAEGIIHLWSRRAEEPLTEGPPAKRPKAGKQKK